MSVIRYFVSTLFYNCFLTEILIYFILRDSLVQSPVTLFSFKFGELIHGMDT
jgi:hypothetical protein